MKKLIILVLVAIVCSKNLRFLDAASDIIKGGSTPEEKARVNSFENLNNFAESMKKLADGITPLINALKTTSKKSLQKIIPGEGFKCLNIQSQFFISKGLSSDPTKYANYWNRKVQQLALNNKPELAQALINFSLDAADSESSVWSKFDMVFDQIRTDNTYSASNSVVNQRNDGKYDIIVTKVTGQFALADDVRVWERSRSFFGGIYNVEDTKMEKVPKNLTKEDVITMLSLFKVVGITLMTELLGIKVSFPDIN